MVSSSSVTIVILELGDVEEKSLKKTTPYKKNDEKTSIYNKNMVINDSKKKRGQKCNNL